MGQELNDVARRIIDANAYMALGTGRRRAAVDVR
jgi:hypothetical protein